MNNFALDLFSAIFFTKIEWLVKIQHTYIFFIHIPFNAYKHSPSMTIFQQVLHAFKAIPVTAVSEFLAVLFLNWTYYSRHSAVVIGRMPDPVRTRIRTPWWGGNKSYIFTGTLTHACESAFWIRVITRPGRGSIYGKQWPAEFSLSDLHIHIRHTYPSLDLECLAKRKYL